MTHQCGGKVLQVDAERRLHCTAARDDRTALQRPLDDRKSIVQRALHLVKHVVVRTPQDDRRRVDDFRALDQNQLIVGDALLHNLFRRAKVARLE